MLKNWFKIFLYQIKNNKLFTALNILGLSMGIAGLVFAILYWNDEHSYNVWNPEKEKVFQVLNNVSEGTYWNTNVAPLENHLKNFPELESHCFLNNWYFNEILEYNGKKTLLNGILDAQSTFFSYFPFEFIQGDPISAIKDDTSIALSEATAQNLFGTSNALGKQLRYSGRTMVVRGVYRIPGKSSFAPLAVTSIIDGRIANESKNENWGNFSFGLLVKLKDPTKTQAVIDKIEDLFYENSIKKWAKKEGISPEEYIKKNGRNKVILEPLSKARLYAVSDSYPEGRGNYQFLMIMMGLSILILFLSIVNYINLATANAIKRAKEVGVRKIIGATKKNIITQFIFEATLITSFALLLALVIVELSLPFYNDFLGKQLVIQESLFYIQLLAIFCVVILVAGIFPAFYVANFETLKVLKGNFGRSKSGVWLRNGMLVLQFAIASFFIIGSYIVHEQVKFMSTKEIGFQGDQVLDIYYRRPDHDDPKIIFNRYHMLKQELLKIKGVEEVSTGAFSFGNNSSSSSSFTYNGIAIQGQNMAVDFELLDMMKIKMLEGRNFNPQISSDTINSMMINETALKQMNEKNPIGKVVDWNDEKLKIIGVVKDFHLYGPQAEIPPMAFFHFKTIDWMSYNLNRVYIKVQAENMEETVTAIEKFWTSKVNTDYPFEYDFVDKNYARTYQTYVKQRNLFSLLNIVVILIAVFGLFALASYSIERRMKEIAIRKTLGAETKTLLKELSRQYIMFCVIGFLIALFPVYYLLGKWLENFAFRIEISILPFIIGFVVLLILTLLIVLSKAYQATRIDVLNYLKYE
ncbi:putative ABC transport system permease protein [Flavobacterium arsenatis]|uniref:ABC transport system permease protein n=1 Tax=Flavobacterium arsenatis TaxID=1484332 RepID=A0ABU1TMK9_9FLAO|nr:ABC transporter permease [Flavobacterium arsenatis]MDR6966667.1 putative ABC transport system permease protein [Flavobacterium arsenatis]